MLLLLLVQGIAYYAVYQSVWSLLLSLIVVCCIDQLLHWLFPVSLSMSLVFLLLELPVLWLFFCVYRFSLLNTKITTYGFHTVCFLLVFTVSLQLFLFSLSTQDVVALPCFTWLKMLPDWANSNEEPWCPWEHQLASKYVLTLTSIILHCHRKLEQDSILKLMTNDWYRNLLETH